MCVRVEFNKGERNRKDAKKEKEKERKKEEKGSY